MFFKEYMKKNRYNYSTLAEELGVNRITVNNWDKGITPMSMNYFVKLCELLDCEPLELLNSFIEMKGGKRLNEKCIDKK